MKSPGIVLHGIAHVKVDFQIHSTLENVCHDEFKEVCLN